MTTYLLDNCIISYILEKNDDVVQKLKSVNLDIDVLAIPAVGHYEQIRGLNDELHTLEKKLQSLHKEEKREARQEKLESLQKVIKKYEELVVVAPVLALTRQDAFRAADVWVAWGKRGSRPRNKDADILIAGQGLARNAVVVTENERDFAVAIDLGLRIELWTPSSRVNE